MAEKSVTNPDDDETVGWSTPPVINEGEGTGCKRDPVGPIGWIELVLLEGEGWRRLVVDDEEGWRKDEVGWRRAPVEEEGDTRLEEEGVAPNEPEKRD